MYANVIFIIPGKQRDSTRDTRDLRIGTSHIIYTKYGTVLKRDTNTFQKIRYAHIQLF
jgi:hypothetical protein